MAQTTASTGFTQETFDALQRSRREPAWLSDERAAAWDVFCEQSLPSRREEEWMRTDVRTLKLDRFAPPADAADRKPAGDAALPEMLLAEGVELGGQVASLDGRALTSGLNDKWASQGVLFGSLEELAREHESVVEPFLHQAVHPTRDKFASLHAALWSGGQLLYVPGGVAIDEPLHCFSAMSHGAFEAGHLLVILEDGAEATLLTETASTAEDADGLHCGAVELFLGKRAHLRFVNLQNWSHEAWHFGHQKAVLAEDASLQWTTAAMGARLAKVNQHVELAGMRSRCQVNGAMFAEGRQHLSYHTLQHHSEPECRSDFLYKTALQDNARTVWRGMIKVDPDATKTDGYQRNDNLLLSKDAKADSIPGLEIETDDVACSHGSTTGRVDEELIFYAQCRGFTRQEAILAIVTGFFQQIFDRITIPSVRDALGLAIARRVRAYE